MESTLNPNPTDKRFLDGSFIITILVILSATWGLTCERIEGAVYAGLVAGVTAGFMGLSARVSP